LEVTEGVAVATQNIYPDVGVAKTEKRETDNGGLALAIAPLRLATAMPVPIPHVTVEIRDTAKRQLVTAIEVLSPTNKRGEGREEYLVKRRRLLLSTAHLMEIDLLRKGQRVPMVEPLPEAPYFVFLGRAENRPLTDVWPINLHDSLPTVPVPLLNGDPDVFLNLQLALTTIYDLLSYDLAIDYHQPPEIELPAEVNNWASERLRARQAKS
jgi:hypothetical protein